MSSTLDASLASRVVRGIYRRCGDANQQRAHVLAGAPVRLLDNGIDRYPGRDWRWVDSGHFVLDENADAIAEAIIETFSR